MTWIRIPNYQFIWYLVQCDYTKIKVHEIPKCRQLFDPAEELARVDWVLISSGIKA